MQSFIIRPPEVHTEAGKTTVTARVETPSESHDLWFRGPSDALLPRGADAFVITCMPTAMKLGLPIRVESNVSPRLVASLNTIQDILCKWHPDLHRVRLEAGTAPASAMRTREGTAAFFSGGVDSFYTTLKHQNIISTLILVHGFDLSLENIELRSRVTNAMQQTATGLGKRLVEIETNSKPFTNRHVDWVSHQFGAALAGVAVLLGGEVGNVLVPSSESYAHLEPCGSHPLLDPLWSTEYMNLIHDGAESTRNEKVAAISRFPPALSQLRVCWENLGNAYNCGRCEKCIRTMLNLEAAGALNRCTAFEATLTAQKVAQVEIPNSLVFFHFEEILRFFRKEGGGSDLVMALEQTLARFQGKELAKALADLPSLNADTPGLARAAGRHASSLLQAMVRQKRQLTTNLMRYYWKRLFG